MLLHGQGQSIHVLIPLVVDSKLLSEIPTELTVILPPFSLLSVTGIVICVEESVVCFFETIGGSTVVENSCSAGSSEDVVLAADGSVSSFDVDASVVIGILFELRGGLVVDGMSSGTVVLDCPIVVLALDMDEAVEIAGLSVVVTLYTSAHSSGKDEVFLLVFEADTTLSEMKPKCAS